MFLPFLIYLVCTSFLSLILTEDVIHDKEIQAVKEMSNKSDEQLYLEMLNSIKRGRKRERFRINVVGMSFYGVKEPNTISHLTHFALDFLEVRMFELPYKLEHAVADGITRSDVSREEITLIYKLRPTSFGIDGTRKDLNRALKRSTLDYFDLLMIPYVDTQDVYLETWKTMIDLKRQGKVRAIGLSNVNTQHIYKVYKKTGVLPEVVQLELHPFLEQFDLTDQLQEMDIIVQAYSVLVGGTQLHHPSLLQLGLKYGKTSAQILVRWCIQHGRSCITSSNRINRVAENVDVFDFQLTADDMTMLNRLGNNYVTNINPRDVNAMRSLDEIIFRKQEKHSLEEDISNQEVSLRNKGRRKVEDLPTTKVSGLETKKDEVNKQFDEELALQNKKLKSKIQTLKRDTTLKSNPKPQSTDTMNTKDSTQSGLELKAAKENTHLRVSNEKAEHEESESQNTNLSKPSLLPAGPLIFTTDINTEVSEEASGKAVSGEL